MKDYEVLEAAAEYIEQYGWHQGGASGPDGSVCALGAIDKCGQASGNNFIEDASLLYEIIFPEFTGIGNWNDQPERTEQEVLDALQKAAKLGRIREDCEAAEAV